MAWRGPDQVFASDVALGLRVGDEGKKLLCFDWCPRPEEVVTICAFDSVMYLDPIVDWGQGQWDEEAAVLCWQHLYVNDTQSTCQVGTTHCPGCRSDIKMCGG